MSLRDAAFAGSFEMVAPTLWTYEVVNGLVSAVNARRVPAAPADQMLVALLSAGVRLVEVDPSDVWRTATDLRLTAYDASYVTLAKHLDCPCWTADRPLLRARRAASWVRPIERFASA